MTNTDAAFVALGVELNKVERRLTDEFGRVFGDIEDKLHDLAERIGELEPPEGPAASAPWVWADMDGDQAAEAWKFLVTWLEEVLWPRHAESAVHLTACWFRHPDVVEELSVLCLTWLAAYRSKDATAVRAAEWLDRWLPGAMRRCSGWLAPCATAHQEYPTARPEPRHNRGELQRWIDGDVARRGAVDRETGEIHGSAGIDPITGEPALFG